MDQIKKRVHEKLTEKFGDAPFSESWLADGTILGDVMKFTVEAVKEIEDESQD